MWLRRLALLERTAHKSSDASLSGFSHSLPSQIPSPASPCPCHPRRPAPLRLAPARCAPADWPVATIRPRPPAHPTWANATDCLGACSPLAPAAGSGDSPPIRLRASHPHDRDRPGSPGSFARRCAPAVCPTSDLGGLTRETERAPSRLPVLVPSAGPHKGALPALLRVLEIEIPSGKPPLKPLRFSTSNVIP